MKVRVINILTNEEIEQVQYIRKNMIEASSLGEIRFFRSLFDEPISKAKKRYYETN